MEDLKAKYEQVVLEKEDIIKRISILAENEKVKEYLSLCKQNDELASQQKNLYKSIKIKDYSSCDHVWVRVLHDYDRHESHSYNYYGCVKCGLNEKVLYLMELYNNPDELNLDERIMYNFLENNYSLGGTHTKLSCDLDLAKAIYSKIKESHPDIDNETAVKYLKVALHFIRDIEVSDERKVSRAKRLSLNHNYFNKRNSQNDIR